MKKILVITLLIFAYSCNKTDDPTSNNDLILETHGILEGFILEDSEIIVESINESNLDYMNLAAKRGFYFKPIVDIEITAVGGRMATVGEYEIEIIESYYDWGLLQENEPVLASKKLTITDNTKFQYIELDETISLLSGHQYVIRYFSENHESVFDAILPSNYLNSTEIAPNLHPQDVTNIEIIMMYYSYFNNVNGEFEFNMTSEGKINAGAHIDGKLFLRGLPDFKYEIKQN